MVKGNVEDCKYVVVKDFKTNPYWILDLLIPFPHIHDSHSVVGGTINIFTKITTKVSKVSTY